MTKQRTFSKVAHGAAALIGKQIKLARKTRKMCESVLAERAGISRATLRKIEAGEMTSAIGIVFELAIIVGVPLFGDSQQIAIGLELTQSKIALMPKRIKQHNKIYDDF